MPRTTRIAKIDRFGQRATVITYRGGGVKGQIEIPGGMQEFRRWIREQARDNHETLIALVLMAWLQANPTQATDFTAIEGKQITLDFDAPMTSGLVTIV